MLKKSKVKVPQVLLFLLTILYLATGQIWLAPLPMIEKVLLFSLAITICLCDFYAILRVFGSETKENYP
jgi:hypothetical protein